MKYAIFAAFIFSATGIQERSSQYRRPSSDNYNFVPRDLPNTNCHGTIKSCFYIQRFRYCYEEFILPAVFVLLIVSIGKEFHALKSAWPRWKSYVTKFSNIQEWMVHCATITAYIIAFEDCGNEERKDSAMWNWALPVIIMVRLDILTIC